MNSFLEIICLVIFIEAVTNIISKSELFSPFRAFLLRNSKNKFIEFAHSIIECPYCLSVWMGLFSMNMFYFYRHNLLHDVFIWFMFAIILHRLSNILHYLIDKLQ
jgi:hypothetical protein